MTASPPTLGPCALRPVTEAAVWLHPGMVKTATSTLQRHVFSHHPKIHYLGLPSPTPELEWAIRHICQADSTHFETDRLQDVLAGGLAGAAADARPLISYENFALHESKDKGLVADRLAALFPNARILFTIRRQEDLVTSWYLTKLRVRIKRKAYIPFEEWYWMEAREPWNSILDDLCFDRMIRRYEALFGTERVSVLTFEEFIREPNAFLRRLSAFLDVDAGGFSAMVAGKRENAAMSNRYLAFWRHASHILPRRFVRNWSRKLTLKGGARARIAMPDAIRAHVRDLVAADNAELAGRRGVDLARWGYTLPGEPAPEGQR